MPKDTATHVVILQSQYLGPQFALLKQVFLPGLIEKDNLYVFLCQDLDLRHGVYLSATVFLPDSDSRWSIQIPHNLVAAILEVESHKNPLGFFG